MLRVGDAFVTLYEMPFNYEWSGHGDIFYVKAGKVCIFLGTNNELSTNGNGAHWCAFFIDGMLGFRFMNFSRLENNLMKAL